MRYAVDPNAPRCRVSDSHHLEEAFSDDGGKTWDPNFVATLTREKQ